MGPSPMGRGEHVMTGRGRGRGGDRGVIEAGRGGRGGPMFGRGGRGRGVFGPGDGWRRPDFPPPVAAAGDVGGEREYGPLAGEISARYDSAWGGILAQRGLVVDIPCF